jgi:transposase
MARAYSQDLRDRVIKTALGGVSVGQAAARYGVGISTAILWVRRARSGEVAARRQGQAKDFKLDAHAAFLLELIHASSQISLHKMQARLREERGVCAGIGTLWRFFHARAITDRKTAHACERDRPDVRAAREGNAYGRHSARALEAPHLCGRPASDRVLHPDGAARADDRPVVCGLRRADPGADTPAGRRGDLGQSAAAQECSRSGARRSDRRQADASTAYSPYFNLIENAFAKLKGLLRNAASRTKEVLWQTIGELLDEFSPEGCANYFRAARYEPQ